MRNSIKYIIVFITVFIAAMIAYMAVRSVIYAISTTAEHDYKYDICGYDKRCVQPKNIFYGDSAVIHHAERLSKSRTTTEPMTNHSLRLDDYIAEFNAVYNNYDYDTTYVKAQAIRVGEKESHFVFAFDKEINNPVFVEYEDYTIFIPNLFSSGVTFFSHIKKTHRFYRLDKRIRYRLDKIKELSQYGM